MRSTVQRSGFVGWLARLLDDLDLTFCKLNRIQFDAPWRRPRSRC